MSANETGQTAEQQPTAKNTTAKPKAAKKPPKEKRCSRCKEINPAKEFLKRKDGSLKAYCAECRKVISRERYATHHPHPEQQTTEATSD
jgi:hypothetical protein